jgi:hypothetical protein
MEGFKSLPKMQCFKEGGAVKSKYAGGGMAYKKGGHAESEEMSKDIAQDKKIVKKAVKLHDEQQHEGKETNLSKLKKGGRMKKEGGCVGRYKAGGSIKMKKDASDIKDIQKIKLTKTKKAEAPSAAMMAEPTPFKKGGYAKKCAEGGSLKPVDAEDNPGLAKLPTNVRNKMGYAKKGGLAKKYANGGMVTEEEKARMPAGKLPQQIVDEEATKENTETREMVAGPLRKLKKGLMETFKSTSKTPMKHGGKAC